MNTRNDDITAFTALEGGGGVPESITTQESMTSWLSVFYKVEGEFLKAMFSQI